MSCQLASIIEHCKLGELIKGKFEWRKENTEAFDELKNMISSDKGEAYLDPRQNTSSMSMGAQWDLLPPLFVGDRESKSSR